MKRLRNTVIRAGAERFALAVAPEFLRATVVWNGFRRVDPASLSSRVRTDDEECPFLDSCNAYPQKR